MSRIKSWHCSTRRSGFFKGVKAFWRASSVSSWTLTGQNLSLDDIKEDSIQSPLPFLGNAATQLSAYRRMKILKEYNIDLVSFSEEMEPELRQQPCCCIRSPNRLQIAWVMIRWRHSGRWTVKERRFLQAPPVKTGLLPGEQTLSLKFWIQWGHQARLLPRSQWNGIQEPKVTDICICF